MPAPVLVPCLVALRAEFDDAGPRRDRSSDGWRGDAAHALQSSDHNPDESGATPYEDADFVDEVHALDVDDSGPWLPGFSFDDAVERIRARHAAGDDDRLQNIIRNGRIASRSWGWSWRSYTGPNGHYEHAHFSARYTTAQENDTRPWRLTVTAPTPEQNAAAAAGRDIDPGPGGYSWGGATWTILGRTAILNSLPGQIQDLHAELAARVDDVDDDLDAMGASLALLAAAIGTLTAAPSEQHPVVAAVRHAISTAPPAV